MKCACCNHEDKDHCKGGVKHSTYKDQARMVPKPKTTACKTRHCTQPLCCCLDFAETVADVKWPNVPWKGAA